MTNETDPGLWRQIAQWLWMPLTALVGVVWSMLTSRINEVKVMAESALPRADFDRASAESRADRQSLRGDVKELFGKTDGIKDMVHAEIANVGRSVDEKLDRLRADMNGAFNRMENMMDKRLK